MYNIGRVVLNTHVDNMGSKVCIFDMVQRLKKAGFQASLNDWSGYKDYDIAFFMGIDHEIDRARKENPDIFIVICDPKQSSSDYIDAALRADLLLVSSIEQRDAFLRLNGNIIVYPMFPDIPATPVHHRTKERLVIGYHGNKVHLEAMGDLVTPALTALARDFDIELRLIYNLSSLGKAERSLPADELISIQHIQWHEDVFEEQMPQIDIGIVPNLLPVHNLPAVLESAEIPGLDVNYEPFDFLTRFKASCNPGRIAVFGKYGIPVVTDFTPSSCQLIDDGKNGFLAGTIQGWYHGLARLAASPSLRQEMGQNLDRHVQAVTEEAFVNLLQCLHLKQQIGPLEIPGTRSVYDDLERYVGPRLPNLTDRVKRRLKSMIGA